MSGLKLQDIIKESQDTPICENTLNQILDHLVKYGGMKQVENLNFKSLNLNALNNLFNLTISYKVNFFRPAPNKLVIQGQFIKLSDCMANCLAGVQFIEIHALNKVFIDCDFDRTGHKVQLSIIAPTWEIIDTKKIILSGRSGGLHYPEKSQSLIGLNGESGVPGVPGGSAGNFLGVGNKFINIQSLSIFVNGGDGGPGQRGADGARGSKGRNAVNITCAEALHTFRNTQSAGDCWTAYGDLGGTGGNGGNGGSGGHGGHAGDVKLFNLSENQPLNVNVNSNNGKQGSHGNGGGGGLGGQNGDICTVYTTVRRKLGVRSGKRWHERSHHQSNENGLSGAAGITGGNSCHQQLPEAKLKFPDVFDVVNGYKKYLIENLSNNEFYKQELIQFYDKINENHDIIRAYGLLGFIQELQMLENQFFKLKDEIDFMPFYQSLLREISQYAQIQNFDEHKQIFSYLYTAVLSKVCLLEDSNMEHSLIIDMAKYLNLVTNNINKLQGLNQEIIKYQYNHHYENIMDHKIQEAERIIEKIMPEIDCIKNEVNNEINILMDEVIALQNNAQVEKDQLIKKKAALKKAFKVGKIVNFIDGAAKLVSHLVPSISPFVNLFNRVTTFTHAIASEENKNKLAKLPAKVEFFTKNIQHLIQTFEQEHKQIFELQKEALSRQKSKNPELSNLIPDANTSPKDLKSFLNKKIAELKTDKTIPEEKLKKISTIVKNVSSIAKIPQDVYVKCQNDEQKINTLNDALQSVDNKISQLKLFEDNIYDNLVPLLHNVHDHVKFQANNMDSKSQVGLKELQWQIQDYMKNVQCKLQKISQGFGEQKNMVQCIEELKDVLTRMISMYDFIEVYRDHKIFADYIASINFTNSNMIVCNKEIQESLVNLEFTIKANVIFSQYFSAVKTLSQYIFPFADLYFADFILPEHLQLSKDINSLVPGIIKHIESIYTKLMESKVTITKYDQFIQYGNFDGNNKDTGPFFTWKNLEYYDYLISKILSGSEVVIKADITKSDHQYNAIKFNKIGLNFKLPNETMQCEFDRELENFSISLTHSGDSCYRWNDEFYIIASDKQTIQYNFATNVNRGPTNRNLIYEKLKSSHFILSPYTNWTIQLVKITDTNFDVLNKYSQDIDLELVGYGQYISKEIDLCNTKLNKYYKKLNCK